MIDIVEIKLLSGLNVVEVGAVSKVRAGAGAESRTVVGLIGAESRARAKVAKAEFSLNIGAE